MAAMDGRVAVEFIDPSEEAQSKKFAFKCHRVPSAEGCLVYPVQAVAHHPCYHSTFATAGGDGCVAIWDGSQRKKLFQTDRHNVGVSSIAFNEQGTILAVGTSRTGALEHSQQEGEGVFIRQIDDVHVRPKSHARPVAQA